MRAALSAVLAALALMSSCGGPAEVVRAPASGCDAGFCPVPDASDERCAGTLQPMPPDGGPPPTPDFGSVVVTVKTAEGLVHAILCGGEVSSDLGQPTPVACPYDHSEADAGRTLLKLDRAEGLTR